MLACFGGAGGQHACAIARNLGMSRVFIHRYSGILSAYGLALADVVHEAQEPCAKEYGGLILCSQLVLYVHVDAVLSLASRTDATFDNIDARLDALTEQCIDVLEKQGFRRFCNSNNIDCKLW